MENKYFPLRFSYGLLVAFAIYFAVLSLSYDEMNNGASLIIATFAGIISISFISYYFRKEMPRKIFLYAIIFYLFRLSIGVVHYLYFFDNEYLISTTTDFSYLPEYIWMFESMDVFSQGLSGEMDADIVQGYADQNKNYEMLLAMSLVFLIGGTKILTIATLNSMVTILGAFLLYFLSLRINNDKKNALFCFFIMCIQPFEIITSILARDTFGQFIVLYSVFLVVFFYNFKTLKLLATLFASWLSSLHREVYFFIPLITGLTSSFIYDSIYEFKKFKKANLIIIVSVGLFGLLAGDFLVDNFISRFLNIDFLSKIITLPISIFYSLVGPFPWSQIFMDVPGVEFHIPQYFTSVFNWCFYLSLILFLANRKPNKLQFVIIMLFGLFYLAGILIYEGKHTVYYSILTPLLAVLDIHSSKLIFLKRFFMITTSYIILTFIYDF